MNIQNYIMTNVRAIVQELETEIRIIVVYKLTTNRNYVIGVEIKENSYSYVDTILEFSWDSMRTMDRRSGWVHQYPGGKKIDVRK